MKLMEELPLISIGFGSGPKRGPVFSEFTPWDEFGPFCSIYCNLIPCNANSWPDPAPNGSVATDFHGNRSGHRMIYF